MRRFWFGLRRGSSAKDGAIAMPPPTGHYPDLAGMSCPDLACIADCAGCGARLFKTAEGVWKAVRLADDRCQAGK